MMNEFNISNKIMIVPATLYQFNVNLSSRYVTKPKKQLVSPCQINILQKIDCRSFLHIFIAFQIVVCQLNYRVFNPVSLSLGKLRLMSSIGKSGYYQSQTSFPASSSIASYRGTARILPSIHRFNTCIPPDQFRQPPVSPTILCTYSIQRISSLVLHHFWNLFFRFQRLLLFINNPFPINIWLFITLEISFFLTEENVCLF
jgi:hypothetical protein